MYFDLLGMGKIKHEDSMTDLITGMVLGCGSVLHDQYQSFAY